MFLFGKHIKVYIWKMIIYQLLLTYFPVELAGQSKVFGRMSTTAHKNTHLSLDRTRQSAACSAWGGKLPCDRVRGRI